MQEFRFGGSRKYSSTAFSLKECRMPSQSRKTTGAQEGAGSIIRRSERKPIAPGEGVQALRKRMTSAQSLVDRATSSKSPASSS